MTHVAVTEAAAVAAWAWAPEAVALATMAVALAAAAAALGALDVCGNRRAATTAEALAAQSTVGNCGWQQLLTAKK